MLRTAIFVLFLIIPGSVVAQEAEPSAQSLQPSTTASNPQTSSVLQPAGSDTTAPQAGNADSISQSPSKDLQQTGSAEQIQLYLQGEGEGAQSLGEEDKNLTWLKYIALVCLAATALTAVAWVLQQRSRPRQPVEQSAD